LSLTLTLGPFRGLKSWQILALFDELPYRLEWYLLATCEGICHFQYVDMLFWDSNDFCSLESIFDERNAGLGLGLAQGSNCGETWGNSQKWPLRQRLSTGMQAR
jgi:hypothetical protein